jgi:hypothetical protein
MSDIGFPSIPNDRVLVGIINALVAAELHRRAMLDSGHRQEAYIEGLRAETARECIMVAFANLSQERDELLAACERIVAEYLRTWEIIPRNLSEAIDGCQDAVAKWKGEQP